MLFSTTLFIFAFIPTVLFGYYFLFRRLRTAQNVFLGFASLFFYAWGEPLFVLVMIGSIFINYGYALWIDQLKANKSPAKIVLFLMLLTNLGILFIFKYLMFTLNAVNLLFEAHISVPTIALPIGISFFTFQAISYVVDVYRKKGSVQKNPLNVLLYISFFPQLIAGPIVRYETIADQIKNRKETFADFSSGLCRFVVGLSKKVIIANSMAVVADGAFSQSSLSVSFAWLGALAYTFQIFFDFSGYSDMAIGLGKMFGFHFLENFNYPYISRSISEFWRRWHISLGTWFKDYVYVPLGGSRVKTKARLIFNLFAVWMLTGIWHGANLTFFLWGLLYFVLITAEKLWGIEKKRFGLGHVYTLFFVIAGWVIFRSNSVSHAFTYLGSMFGLGVTGLTDRLFVFFFREYGMIFLLALIFSLPVGRFFAKITQKNVIINLIYPVVIVLLFLVSVSYMVKGSYNPFIYFNF